MTASLSSHYALVGETQPSQPPHQKGLPPAPPHASAVPAVVKPIEKPKPALAKPVSKTATVVPGAVKVTNVPALPTEPVILGLPDVPAMGS